MTNGDCFVVLPENCAEGTLIIGRNAEDEKNVNVASEVCFYDATEVLEGKVKTDSSENEARSMTHHPNTSHFRLTVELLPRQAAICCVLYCKNRSRVSGVGTSGPMNAEWP